MMHFLTLLARKVKQWKIVETECGHVRARMLDFRVKTPGVSHSCVPDSSQDKILRFSDSPLKITSMDQQTESSRADPEASWCPVSLVISFIPLGS